MSFSDCPKCWDTPCTCCWEVRHCSDETFAKLIADMLKHAKNKHDILEEVKRIIENSD